MVLPKTRFDKLHLLLQGLALPREWEGQSASAAITAAHPLASEECQGQLVIS